MVGVSTLHTADNQVSPDFDTLDFNHLLESLRSLNVALANRLFANLSCTPHKGPDRIIGKEVHQFVDIGATGSGASIQDVVIPQGKLVHCTGGCGSDLVLSKDAHRQGQKKK
jgi:hypothetical protein